MLVRSRNTSFQRPTIGLLGLPPKDYRITGITGQVIDCHRAAMRRTKMLIRRTPLAPQSRPLRRLTPLRQVSDRMLMMDPGGCARPRAGRGTRRQLRSLRQAGCRCPPPAASRLGRSYPGFVPVRVVPVNLVVRECHCWVESRRTLANGLGLLVRRGVTPLFEGPGVSSWPVGAVTDDGLGAAPG